MLGFVSPLAEPPNLSDRQCGLRLGIGHIKEKLLRRAIDKIEEKVFTPHKRFTLERFTKCLHAAGILWLGRTEIQTLYDESLLGVNKVEGGQIDQAEWRIQLGDIFMFDIRFLL